jgi:TonB family protein
MRIILSLCFLLASYSYAQAASDTVYYNKNWKTCSKKRAHYFTPPPVVVDGRYKVTDYYISGKPQMEGYYDKVDAILNPDISHNDYRNGYFKYYYADGLLSTEGTYKNGKRHGLWKEYTEGTDKLSDATTHKDGKLNGECKSYYPNGKIKIYSVMNNDVPVSMIKFDSTGTEIGNVAMPECPYNLKQYIIANLHYPEFARRNSTEGVVPVRFVVDEQGKIMKVRVVDFIGDGCEAEAVRVVKSMPAWKPATLNGKPIRVEYTLPINFKLVPEQ